MARPVTLFTGPWADLPLEEVAKKANEWGYDGLELAGWGDHFEVDKALESDKYLRDKRELLQQYNLKCWAIGTHLVGQCVCDPIDERHKKILPARLWDDGDPEGIRRRCAEEVANTARAASRLGVNVVTGFTGSPIWHLLYAFPAHDFAEIEAGYREFADRWNPIMDVFDVVGVRFGLEVHPTEIAYDFVTTEKAFQAINRRPAFGLNLNPSHLVHQHLDPAAFVDTFADRIYHVHIKDAKKRLNDGRRSILGSHLDFGDPRRGWNFVSPGRGDVDFEEIIRALNRTGYDGPLSVAWEDSSMDREWGAPEALAFVRRLDFTPADVGFDAAFSATV